MHKFPMWLRRRKCIFSFNKSIDYKYIYITFQSSLKKLPYFDRIVGFCNFLYVRISPGKGKDEFRTGLLKLMFQLIFLKWNFKMK